MIDIGFSSPQVDQQHRGFSVVEDGPLDLRMNPTAGRPLGEWLQTASAEEVAWLIREWGEDDDPVMALRIAEAVLARQRRSGPYKSTLVIAEVIRQAKMCLDDRGQHPAKLTFQAFRVFINHEMEQLRAFLDGAVSLLQPGARAVVITFKKPEATIVKQFLRDHEVPRPNLARVLSPRRLAELYPLLQTSRPFAVRLASAPSVPSAAEVAQNRRSRSAMVHALERIERPPPADMLPPGTAAPRPLEELFCRPVAIWRNELHGAPVAKEPPALACLPPRTSGAVCAALLARCPHIAAPH
eukprot:NODE_2058_length_2304_cov_6.096463.p1 GENE.NODE_2058_length_2304_cov_6.096463~~NODE_2058_length_2304_cov_6.096463.p1  ORF type:complete len:298 (+),score=116.38 NODE_2058_length_2304_cov_6.096463:1348-2241(+)